MRLTGGSAAWTLIATARYCRRPHGSFFCSSSSSTPPPCLKPARCAGSDWAFACGWRSLPIGPISPMKRQKREKELEEEIQSHLQMAINDRMERGESAEDAESAARREFGNIGLIKETTRGMWRFAALETIWQDLRYGARMLMKTPGFTLTAVLTLALGVGAVAAIFSVVDAVLLRPLPAHHPERLVALYTSGKDGAGYRTLTYSDYVYYRDNQKSLEGLAAYARVPVNWREGDRVEQI